MGIVIKGRVQGMVIGNGAQVTTHNGQITSVNGRSGAEWQRRLDAARDLGVGEELAQWYAALDPSNEAAAVEMFQSIYGRAPLG